MTSAKFFRFLRCIANAPIFKRSYVQHSTKFALLSSSAFAIYKGCVHPVTCQQLKQKVNNKLIIEEADRMYNSNLHPRELYQHLKQYEITSDAEILWRICRAARDLALKVVDISKDEKKALVYEAFEFAKKALEADDYNFASHKWYAITIGDVGDYEGTKIKISNAFIIRDHLQRASELNPKDATTLHCLGMWCFVFADMPGWQRTIASFIFGTPPTSTFPEAAEYFMQAERVDPNFYSINLLMLGKTYMKMNDKKRAMLFFDRTIHYPIVTAEDEQAKKEAEELLKEVIGK
uniref:Regulator of microtubule dynamics protein 1 n=1 Tax=Phallusia mammillata TaxID=59560 RepID=A0A6F9DCN9_9ASCI|nr:regulator of microtubule dynamics protein 1-like [Phallusia mammillata]